MSARSRGTIALATVGVALLAAVAAPPAVASSGRAARAVPSVSSGGVGGYSATGTKFTSVSTEWTQPTLRCTGTGTSSTSFWAGLDGDGDSVIEQTGTEADCVNGTAEYFAWWETYPSAEVVYSGVTVRPGDQLSASVSTDGSGTFTMTVTDATEGWTKTTKHASTGQGVSAEVFAETSAGAPAGSVTFEDSLANGKPLGGFEPTASVIPGGTTSPIGSGGGFTVTWS